MIERFNGRIADVLATTRYVRIYNQHITQKALGHIAPIAAMKKWHLEKPELFKKQVYNLTGLDTYSISNIPL